MAAAHPLWDLPVRLFHWSLVALIPACWASAEFDRLDLHEWFGYVVLVLVVARFVWGVIGSQHARFADFLAGPGRIVPYVRGEGSSIHSCQAHRAKHGRCGRESNGI